MAKIIPASCSQVGIHRSLNARAEANDLLAWSSWPEVGFPSGYYPTDQFNHLSTFFGEQGFCVLESALDVAEIAELRQEALAICRGERGELPGIEPALASESDDDVLKKYLCIHFPHKISQKMKGYISHPMITKALTHLVGPNVKCMQSMLFIKAAGKPGQAWHQDEIYIPTRDRSLIGAWIAMDDATVENGCLWVLPGSQKRGVLYQLEAHNDRRFDCSAEAQSFPYSNDDAVPVEVKAGSIVFFNGYLLHRSLPNLAKSGYRRSLVNHYMSAESLLPWFGDKIPHGDAVSTADNRDILLVAGEDPYSYKGIENRNGPHVRPSGEGGCGNIERNEEAKDR